MSKRGSIYFDKDGNLGYTDENVLEELAISNTSYNVINCKLTEEMKKTMICILRATYNSRSGKKRIQRLIDSDNHQDLIKFYGFGGICSEKELRSCRNMMEKRKKEIRYNNNLGRYEYEMDKKKVCMEEEKKWKHYWLSAEGNPINGKLRLSRLRTEAKHRLRRCLSESDIKHDEWFYFNQKITGKVVIPLPPNMLTKKKRI